MNITKESQSNCSELITLHFESADFNGAFDEKIKELRKKAHLKGFRPGTVPATLIKKMYGAQLFQEKLNDLINENLHNYFTEQKINVVTRPFNRNEPDLSTYSVDNIQPFSLSFEVGFVPPFELVYQNEDFEVPYYNITVSDEDVDKELNLILKYKSVQQNAETVGLGDLIKANLVEIDSEGNEKEGGHVKEDALFSLEYMEDSQTRNKFDGACVGNQIIVNFLNAYKNLVEVKTLLGLEEDNEALKSDYKATITEIKTLVAPELNQEFFDSFTPSTKITTEEEFKEYLKKNLIARSESESIQKFKKDIKDILIEKHPISWPVELTKESIRSTASSKAAAEMLTDEELNKYIEYYKWNTLLSNIAKELEITASNQEAETAYVQEYINQLMYYGMQPEFDKLKLMLDSFRKDENLVENYKTAVLENKTFIALKEIVKKDTIEISFEDFLEIGKENEEVISE